jgi:hypothetical protein
MEESTSTSTTPEETNIIDVEIIPLEAEITIKISGQFVARLSNLLTNFFPYKDKNHFQELVKHIQEDTNQDDPYVYNFATLVALQSFIEQEAKEQKLTKMVKIDKVTGALVEGEINPTDTPPTHQE